jgi:acetyl/propionyl-CoA carboxylase alpha subunit
MRHLGSKAGARALAGQVNVPIIPGVDGANLSVTALRQAAAEIGFPVLIKASAGGGGKGLRVVEAEADFDAALRAARNESLSSFGSDHILLEKYFTEIRHVEVQILGDRHGNIVHLFERECSIQRRHQKIIEATPSPAVGPELRQEMCAAALALARAVGYISAGTLEFMVTPDGRYYFLEMNTRLQVEHPITELVTGLDLAAWQIRLAAGEPLSFSQEQVSQRGHALECRVYAEDAANNFMPSIGEITFYRRPAGPGVRVDDGINAGTSVSPYYDPMLAKVITWGADRPEAIRKMARALQDTVLLGVTTNIPYLLAILSHPTFLEGQTTTSFIAEHMVGWQPEPDTSRSTWLAAAALEVLQGSGSRQPVERREDGVAAPRDPWGQVQDWRNVG